MARLGLAPGFRVTFANDIDSAKADTYRANHGTLEMRLDNVCALTTTDLPGRADLAWASFPCQDLSLAGARAGLQAPRSGAFWGFWRLMEALDREGRGPDLIVLENVRGLLTSRGGADFSALVAVLAEAGYRVGAVEIDAASFVPQSRLRVFMIASRIDPAASLLAPESASPAIARARDRLDALACSRWVDWRLPPPPQRNTDLEAIVERDELRSSALGAALLELMAPRQRAIVETLRGGDRMRVGAAFRRIRIADGRRAMRAEARFDGLAGCLRTPAGGSSRQFVVFAGQGEVTARLMTARESARLMGLDDGYRLPTGTTRALHLVGDGVVVPVVRWLTEHLLTPLVSCRGAQRRVA